MAAAEVVQLDAIRAAADRQLVRIRPLRQKPGVVSLERVHLRHVRFGVLVGDDVDRRREHRVAAGVVTMRMGVDDHRHRLIGDGLDLVEDHLAPAAELGVDNDDAIPGDEHAGVAATERFTRHRRGARHVQVVSDLFDPGCRDGLR